MKRISISCILVVMATLSARATDDAIAKLAEDPRCGRGLAWIDRNVGWVTEQQVRLSEIPAPEFKEAARGEALRGLFESSGFKVRVDQIGDVIAERPGSDGQSVVLLAAHLDTVFPQGTDVRVRRRGSRLIGPGISDNGAGLGALVGLARAIAESGVRTSKTIVLAGDVGEEGEGNLRGIRAIVEHYRSQLAAVIAVDGPATDYITTQGIASRRFEFEVTGPGGHSWSDFGEPNPITALARGLVLFSTTVQIPDETRSSYNFGVMEGGTSVNSIPSRAAVKVDLRSQDEDELSQLETALRQAMTSGVQQENAASSAGDSDPPGGLRMTVRSLGMRPAGQTSPDSSLVTTIRNVDGYLGNRSRLERSSTDANFPMSLGIPAVAIGGGGKGGGAHTPEEWYDPTGRNLGLKRLFLAVVALAGLEQTARPTD